MRKCPVDTIFSTVHRELLTALLLHSKRSWYLSELMRHLGRTASQLHRELAALTEGGILRRRVEGRQTYFDADPECSFLIELEILLRKVMGPEPLLKEALSREKNRIAFAFVTDGSTLDRTSERINVVAITSVPYRRLVEAVAETCTVLGRSINIEQFKPGELRSGKARQRLMSYLRRSSVQMLVGRDAELRAILRKRSR